MKFLKSLCSLSLLGIFFSSCSPTSSLNGSTSASHARANTIQANRVSEASARPYVQPTVKAKRTVRADQVVKASSAKKPTVGKTPMGSKGAHKVIRGVRTTAYSCKENEKGGIYGRKTASGTTLRYGAVRSAAADWSRYPLGTKFQIIGQPQVYVIDDYGSALVGTDTIDIYKPNLSMMNSWGVRHVDIEVLEWGCYDKSYHLVEGRKHVAPHCWQMYKDLKPKVGS